MSVASSLYFLVNIMFFSHEKKTIFDDVIMSTVPRIICSAWASFQGRKEDSLGQLH